MHVEKHVSISIQHEQHLLLTGLCKKNSHIIGIIAGNHWKYQKSWWPKTRIILVAMVIR